MPLFLIIVAIILIIYSIIAIKKENKLQNEHKDFLIFKNVLHENESGLSDYKFELGVLRKDIGESLNDLQQEILEIKTVLNINEENNIIYEEKTKKQVSINESSKASAIKTLIEEGLTDEEISRRLSVTKGEILLVKNLYKK